MFSIYCVLIIVALVSESITTTPVVVVLSFDGIRSSDITLEKTPKLQALRNESTSPAYMTSVFPTKTFVTHHTAATGLYPDQHGVIGNKIFDANGKMIFHTQEQFQTNKSVVPIWISNELIDGRYSGVMMWPGSEFEYAGSTPSHVQKYDPEMDWDERVDKIIGWISDRSKPANLVMAYFEDAKDEEHSVNSQNRNVYIKKVDDTIKKIYDRLNDLKLKDNLDMVIISDHGTHEVEKKNFLIINKYTENCTEDQLIATGPITFIRPTEGKYETVYNELITNADYKVKYAVYKKDNMPPEWHMNGSPHLNGVLLVVANPGYTFFTQSEYDALKADETKIDENGYDITDVNMKAFFWAIGPKFKNNLFPKESINIIEIYPLLLKLLDLNPPNKMQFKQQMSGTMLKLLE